MSADDYDPIVEFHRAIKTSERKSAPVAQVSKADVQSDADTRINFRINSQLKADFEALCKREHSTLSSELKRFIVQAVKRDSLS